MPDHKTTPHIPDRGLDRPPRALARTPSAIHQGARAGQDHLESAGQTASSRSRSRAATPTSAPLQTPHREESDEVPHGAHNRERNVVQHGPVPSRSSVEGLEPALIIPDPARIPAPLELRPFPLRAGVPTGAESGPAATMSPTERRIGDNAYATHSTPRPRPRMHSGSYLVPARRQGEKPRWSGPRSCSRAPAHGVVSPRAV